MVDKAAIVSYQEKVHTDSLSNPRWDIAGSRGSSQHKKCLISWLLDIRGKDGLHFEIEFHHFLFSRFTINQQIQENLMVREYHKLPHGPPSPVLPLEPPQQKVRGPAGGGEEGSQCDNPTQQQVLTGGPAGWDPPQFSSTDVRERVQKEKLSPSSLVTLFTRYCHQKPGGGFTLPKIAASDFCPFCDQGNTCLGQFLLCPLQLLLQLQRGKSLLSGQIL